MLDEGCEAVLREAGKLRGCIDEAYGALRDLQCEVRHKNYCVFGPYRDMVRVSYKIVSEKQVDYHVGRCMCLYTVWSHVVGFVTKCPR